MSDNGKKPNVLAHLFSISICFYDHNLYYMLGHKQQKNCNGNDSLLRVTELLMPLRSEDIRSRCQVGSIDFQLWSAKLDAEAVSESSSLLDSSNMLSLQVVPVVKILLVLPAD